MRNFINAYAQYITQRIINFLEQLLSAKIFWMESSTRGKT